MPVNLELKVKINSFNKIKALLENNKAEFKGILKQKDIYYKISSGLLKLRIENGNQSIIKYLRDENSKNRFSDYAFINLNNYDGEKFFSGILNVEAVVEKKRLLYLYDNTRIHLDNVKNLGYFLELETLVLFGKPDARKRFDIIKKLLKLDEYEQIKKSYRDLIINSVKK